MQTTSRDGNAEIKRATAILKIELPTLPIPPSPGHATVINLQFESGLRGPVLDFNNQLWFKMDHGSSSCNLDHADVIADGSNTEVKIKCPVGLFNRWDLRINSPGWPHRPCVYINRKNESIAYFDRCVELSPQQYRIVAFYAEWSQSQRGPAPDHKLYANELGGADLKVVISRIRRAFRDAAAQVPGAAVCEAATALVDELFPAKTQGIGYSIGRPELFQMK